MRQPYPVAGTCARLSLLLILAACTAPPPQPPPAATVAEPAPVPALVDRPQVEGFSGPIEPLAAPAALSYRPARFRGVTTISVETASSPASSLGIHVSGSLGPQPDGRLQATLVTEQVDVDGARSDNAVALLVQEIGLGDRGELIQMTSRTPASTGQLPDRYRALEQGWRDRLPLLAAAPVAAGQAIEAEDRRLTPLRLMLGGRDVQLEPVTPLRTVAVGTTACGAGTCLIGRRTGAARLTGGRGPVDVTVTGYGLLDLATGLFVRERERIVLTAREPDGSPRQLVMSINAELELR